jgi:RNase H-like domain found in reverse transcriptase
MEDSRGIQAIPNYWRLNCSYDFWNILDCFNTYLLGHKFVLKTDHRPLQHLKAQPKLSQRQARWVIFLQEHDFEWEYVSGPSSLAADALSRHGYSPIHATWNNLHQMAKHGAAEDTVALNTTMVVEAMEVSELASQ